MRRATAADRGGPASTRWRSMNKLFLSFSVTNDQPGRHFVRLLHLRAQLQGIESWVYESPGGRIRSGGSITLACREKIETADIFVVYITDQSVQSDYVDMEVSHALWVKSERQRSGGDLLVVPLHATSIPQSRWPPALAEIAGTMGHVLLDPHTDALETVVLDLCGILGLDYVPPRPVTPRLPLTQRLVEEVKQHRSSKFDMSDMQRLIRRCDAAVDAHNDQNYEQTRRLIDAILLDLELDYGLSKPYYPRVAYASIMLAEAYAGKGRFEDVEKYFARLIEENGRLLDASAFAGRGNARLALTRYEEALEDYELAEQRLESPDPALLYNIVRARTLAGHKLDRADIDRRCAELDDGLATRQPGDISRLGSVLALSYAYVGDSAAALRQWQAIPVLSDVFPEIVLEICHFLHEAATTRFGVSGTTSSVARSILAGYLEARSGADEIVLAPLRHLEARICYEAGELSRARSLIGPLTDRFPGSPVLTMDAALFALSDHDRVHARSLCQRVATLSDPSACQPPISYREFHYAQGQAFWLLGRAPEAAESFRRSEYPSSHAYETVLRSQFGQLR
jgi:tetratricopeptide (TPR) repeat protein